MLSTPITLGVSKDISFPLKRIAGVTTEKRSII